MDVDAISSDSKVRYVRIGNAFSSERTLAQGLHTLVGWRAHGPVLSEYGFVEEDAQELEQVVGMLQAAGVGREGIIIEKKTNAVELLRLVKQGKNLRSRVRNLTTVIVERLGRAPNDDERALISKLEVTLDHTDTSGAEPQRLIDQLKLLRSSFDLALFAVAAVPRGGDGLRAQLDAFIPQLQTAADALDHGRGTPEATTRLNLLDGIIVELVRSARRAARAAARDLGRPELEQVFGLSELYEG